MAGTYPDVPGYRFVYDADGTIVVYHNITNGTNVTQSAATLQSINNEDPSTSLYGSGIQPGHLVFLFPELRDVSGILINTAAVPITAVQWSNNTTTGLDGTWDTVAGVTPISNAGSRILLRTSINSVSLSAVSALRLNNNNSGAGGSSRLCNVHFYGAITGSESPDRLRIVDLSDDDIAAQFDFGDIPQRSNVTKQFKVTNNSSTQTANNITVELSTLSNASPSLIGQFQVSTDNIAFANAINIGNLAPGASSGTLYVRDTVASNAQLSVWTARITASAVSWS